MLPGAHPTPGDTAPGNHPAPSGSGGPSTTLAEQLSLACTDDTLSSEECVPLCASDYHGFLMLLSIDGDDTKLSCELNRGLYSWVGAASEGGYIGADAFAFLSAILSHAGGRFVCNINESQDVSTAVDLVSGQSATLASGHENLQ